MQIESSRWPSAQMGQLWPAAAMMKRSKFWEVATGKELKNLRLPQIYEGMNITGVTLTPAQKTTLIALGAIDDALHCR